MMPGQAERFRADYAELSQRDRMQLIECAEWSSVRTGLEASDLISEAVQRIIDGRRNWPETVPLVPFLINVMRSIGDAERTKKSREYADGTFSYRPGGGHAGASV